MKKVAAAILSLLFYFTTSIYAQPGELKTLNDEVTSLIEKRQYDRAATSAKQALDMAEMAGLPDSPDLATSLHNAAELHRIYGKFALAEPLFKRALASREKTLGPDHPDVAQSLNGLGQLNLALERYTAAESQLRRALVIREKVLGPTHPDVARSLLSIANFHVVKAQFPETGPLYQRALAIYEMARGADHPDVASALVGVAVFQLTQGQHAQAELVLKRALEINEKALGPDHPDVGSVLGGFGVLYYVQNKFANAEALFKRALAIFEKSYGPEYLDATGYMVLLAQGYQRGGQLPLAELYYKRALAIQEKTVGPDSTSVSQSLLGLASLYMAKGDFPQAERLFERVLPSAEKLLGPDHLTVGTIANSYAELYRQQGKFVAAESFYARALSIYEKTFGPKHPAIASILLNLAAVETSLGSFALSETHIKRAMTINEGALGPQHSEVARSANELAELYRIQGRYAQAEQHYKRAVAISEKSSGRESREVAIILNNLGLLYSEQGRYAEAEPLYKRSLAITEKAQGPDHPEVAARLNNLAQLYAARRQFTLAEALHKRALAIVEKTLGPDHINLAKSLSNIALIEIEQGNFRQAVEALSRSHAILEKALGPAHAEVGQILNNLGGVYFQMKDYAQAEIYLSRALAIREKALGADHAEVATSIINLAGVYRNQGKIAEAESGYKRSLAIYEQALGPNHPNVVKALGMLLVLSIELKNKADVIAYSRRAFQAIRQRFSINAGTGAGAQSEQKSMRGTIAALILLLRVERDAGSTEESFDAFQLAQGSSVGQSVAQMAVRFAAQGGELAKVIRERQDGEVKLAATDKALLDAVSQAPAKRDNARIAKLRQEVDTLETALIEQTRTISSRFPEYDALVSPAPIAVAELQKLLKPDEAMVTYLTDDTVGTFAWVLRADSIDFQRLKITSKQLASQVSLLRSQLDPMQNQTVNAFDAKAANALYEKVFAPLEASLSGARHIILVPDGALQSLPFSVLVDKIDADAKSNTWLADRFAFSTIPSVAALRALRTFNRTALGDIPFVGFGNPVLGGQPGERRGLVARSIFGADASSSTAQGPICMADVNAIRQADPLPETADELRALAKTLSAPATALYLQDRATETAVKQMDLSRHRIIAFATHGVMAGEMSGMVEPGLILTPPKEGTVLDDGYLTASEVAQLKLSADWVLLSACNTAAPDGTVGAEGLSGLAKAFFYAGARSLLVSNWYVESESAVLITTEMLKSYAADTKLGKAEALRVSMQRLRSNPKFTHPLYWAPFTVVGEGGTRLAAQ